MSNENMIENCQPAQQDQLQIEGLIAIAEHTSDDTAFMLSRK
jgi:hypothetical protein